MNEVFDSVLEKATGHAGRGSLLYFLLSGAVVAAVVITWPLRN